ncbi:type VII toxin-antitoxin system HepT family RNase toxin [Ferdinandcohnia quinoae]|uniref:DUF86 domain-containing protein n=1 Tax=Fredinandcohnia quinoae TaxID=2918902 RepID=A0AAW5E820_9BACI|nr:DUF86 domain-containing protein [Fredinandcohnia sp. SECRCQ15]
MYFVDREKIERTLKFIEEHLLLFNNHSVWTSIIEKKALERISQLLIDAVLDVGNSMIDGFIMRDPGSYDDIIDILEDEKVITSAHANQFKDIIRLRKILVQDYLEVNHDELILTIRENLTCVQSFPQAIRTYLENELGPVSAFSN